MAEEADESTPFIFGTKPPRPKAADDDDPDAYLVIDYEGEEAPTAAAIPNGVTPRLVLLGYVFSVAAGICFTSSNVLVKSLTSVSSWEILFMRSTIQIVLTSVFMVLTDVNPLGPTNETTFVRWRIIAQGLLGGLMLFAIFIAVNLLPLGDATAIFFSSPVFTMILSFFLIRDHCGIFRTVISVLLLTGVVLLSRPPSIFNSPDGNTASNSTAINGTTTAHGHDNVLPGAGEIADQYSLVGLAAAFAVPILSALVVIIQRQVKHVSLSVLVFWFGIGGFIVSLVGKFLVHGANPDHMGGGGMLSKSGNSERALSLLAVFLGILGTFLITKAVCWVTPARVMVIRSFEVLCAYVLQVTVFHTPTYFSDLGGAALVVIAVLGMGAEVNVMRRLNWSYM